MRALVVLTVCLWAFGAIADELPASLLMKCEGKRLALFSSGMLPDERKFETTLRLKDGELSDTDSISMTAKGCNLGNGVVHCESKSIVDLKPIGGKGSERRELEYFITRETGEYRAFLETWSFKGSNATGRQTSNLKMRWTGVCRPIGKPIF